LVTLDQYLDAARADTAMVIGRATASTQALKTALAGDPTLQAAARARIAATKELEPRDAITHWQNVTLRAALRE
jgi:hypothetical protein